MRTVRYVLSLLALWLAVLGSAHTQTALQLTPMTPCRLLDTRNGQPLMGGQPLTVPVQGHCGVPANALAYSFNVTVVPRGLLDYLTLWPDGQNRPVVSTINSYDGRIKAVAAIIPAGLNNGAVDAYSPDTTDLILDINGYFLSSANSTLAFYPLVPCRLYDTRGGNYLHARQTVDFGIQNTCGIPASAQAYSLNFTALPLHGYLNFLTAWPAGQVQPGTSTLNAPTGTVTANAALVQSGTDGQIAVFAYNDTDLVIDTNGYFAPPGATGQLALYTLPPCRVLDTRPMYFQGQQTVQVGSSPCTVPSAAQAYIINATVLPQGFLGFLTLWGQGMQPTVSTLNAWDGAVTSNLAIVPANTADGTFQAFASNSTQLLIDIFSYLGLAPLGITNTQLPDGTLGVAYDATLGGTGGVPPYTWAISGSLPPGLLLDANTGLISGIPTMAGTSNFTAQVTDSQMQTAGAPLQITINPSLNNGALNGNYVFSLNGFSQGAAFFAAGSFVADGNGSISSGVLDLNAGSGSPSLGTAFTGSCMIAANGLGTMSLNAGTLGTLNFHLALAAQGSGQLILDNADPNPRGSGAFFAQTTQDFLLPPAGPYALGSLGTDATLHRYAKAGAFQLDSLGVVTTGSEDIDDNGTLGNRTFGGHFLAPGSQSGRGQASFTFPNGVTNNYAYYVVSHGQFILVGTDPLSGVDPLTLGNILAQTAGGFSNASLQGASIVETTGLAPNGGTPVADVALGRATWDGNGNGVLSLDENVGGTTTEQQLSAGIYSVAANGRVTLPGFGTGAPILYLTNVNQGFILGQDNSVASGILEPQSAPPYNNLSIFGTYLGGTVGPAQSALVDSVAFLFADGNGGLNGMSDTSGPSGTGTQDLAATYQVDASGRAVLTGAPAGFMYVVSAHKVVLLPSGSNPILSSFSTGATD